eukprot:symbB.v1.2.031908.t1/scaffold3756.1/size50862/2
MHRDARWIAQKYIENPLIVNCKKFDIRQWVLVTRWSPLAAWFYEDCYLRFSFADYNPKRLKNKFSHLTNNSISKHAEGFEEEKEETMWHSEEFREFLMTLTKEGDGSQDPWAERVQPAMKSAVLRSLEAAQDNVVHRSSSFELFGYDFMVDEAPYFWGVYVRASGGFLVVHQGPPNLSKGSSTVSRQPGCAGYTPFDAGAACQHPGSLVLNYTRWVPAMVHCLVWRSLWIAMSLDRSRRNQVAQVAINPCQAPIKAPRAILSMRRRFHLWCNSTLWRPEVFLKFRLRAPMAAKKL